MEEEEMRNIIEKYTLVLLNFYDVNEILISKNPEGIRRFIDSLHYEFVQEQITWRPEKKEFVRWWNDPDNVYGFKKPNFFQTHWKGVTLTVFAGIIILIMFLMSL